MIFLDTSFLVAYALSSDSRHADARALSKAFDTGRLATSTLVLGETWTTLRRRIGFGLTRQLFEAIRSLEHATIARIDTELEDQAWAWLMAHDERPYSFVDATSFALMRKLRITEALALDGDFAAAGFVELRP